MKVLVKNNKFVVIYFRFSYVNNELIDKHGKFGAVLVRKTERESSRSRKMEGEEDILKYLNLDPDHHEKIAALIPKVRTKL